MEDANKAEATATKTATRRRRATRTGIVVSHQMSKSVVVKVDRLIKHPLYKRYVRRSTKFMAHDEGNECYTGDKVIIEECRPLSKRKRWRVKQVLRKVTRAGGGAS